jgi:pimeloyl-ACP methyl ester carboxylesterase
MICDVNGIELYWEEAGDGEPLLWLHGMLGCGADWRYVFPEPPAGYRIVAPDLRGHGASTNPSGAFSFRQCAHDIAELLRRLGLARVKAIGVSGGGITLLHMAVREPENIASMVVVSAPPYFPPEARVLMRQVSESMFGAAEMERMLARHKGGAPQLQQLLAVGRGLADSYDDVNFTPPYLSTIAAQTLIVFGDRDPLYPVSIAIDMYRAIPRSYLWVVPNGAHGPVFGDCAPLFVKTAMQFLRGEWSPPAPLI